MMHPHPSSTTSPASPATASAAVFVVVASLAVAMTPGCLQRDLKELNPCLVSGVTQDIAVSHVDKVDLLFVVDDSKSMAQEQASLRREFPSLVRALTTGEQHDADGNVRNRFPAVSDLHLGVVSTDMGLPGVSDVDGCKGLGDDGRLQNVGSADLRGCGTTYPSYLQFREGDDPVAVAQDFQCIASLGTGGCGFEQPLEAALKALWPALDIDRETGMQWVDPQTGMPGNRVTFLPDVTGIGRMGHGDGHNAGFLRNTDAGRDTGGDSLIAVIVVTDEEDCSSIDTTHLTPASELPAGHPLAAQPLNLRCHHNPDKLYDVERYVNGLRALRPGNEHLVVFGAIAGVPADLVQLRDDDGNPIVALDDEANRERWYQRILSDDRMIERIDTTEPIESARGLVPSCNTPSGEADPPRRLVEVARGFGANGIVQSICQQDFSGAIDAIVEIVGDRLGAVCLPRELNPDADGLVGCEVLWELPVTAASAAAGAPRRCSDAPYLHERAQGEPQVGKHGGALCRVEQLAVAPVERRAAKSVGIDEADRQAIVDRVEAVADGWFYDDFSQEVIGNCPQTAPQRVTFTEAATPPSGVRVILECLSERQSLAADYANLDAAFYRTHDTRPVEIGDPCGAIPDAVRDKAGYYDGLSREGEPRYGAAAGGRCATGAQQDCADDTPVDLLDPNTLCRVRNVGGQFDERMFCDPDSQVCVRRCMGDDGCPPAWVCDERRQTPICINPTCGE